jgi:RHS repeat-associated protein
LYTKEFYIYGSQRLGYFEDDAFLGRKCIGKFCNIIANPTNPMPFIGTQKTLPTLPPIVIQPMVSSSVGVMFGKKRYEISDWLGNVRVVINDRKTPVNIGATTVGYKAQVMSVSDYYSFGSEIAERSYEVNNSIYRFSYSGHEKINEISGKGNQIDLGARYLDTRIGRISSIDPKAKEFPEISPYVYALNTPIRAIDPDGKLVIFVNGYRFPTALFKDIDDPLGTSRAIKRFFVGEKIYRKDEFNYWGKIDDMFMKRIGDYNVVYADASSHGLSSAMYRYYRGKEAGEALLKKIQAGEIKLQTDEHGNVIESIKIVSHSQGGAYAAGISNVLTAAGYKVEVEYYIAPKQPSDIPQTKAERRVQYGSEKDIIAPQSPMEGVEQGGPPEKEGPIQGHLLENYKNIFNIQEEKKGYVAPRKDIKKNVKENGINLWQIILLFTIFASGCINRDEQKVCFKQKQEEYRKMPLHLYLRKSLKDSLESWIKKDLRLRGHDRGISYAFNKCKWEIGKIILFNKDYSRAILLVLEIDKEESAVLDYIEMIAAEKRDDGWWFYYVDMPFVYCDRRDNNNKPYTFEQLEEIMINEFIRGGYFKKWTCDIDYWYVDGWFDRKGRDLYKWHREFLNRK